MTRDVANWFHDRAGELFTQSETPFDRNKIVQLVNDSVDPIQQVESNGDRYYGIISFDEHDGWYEYTRWDDTFEEVNIGVCAKCIQEADSADKVTRTLGDETDIARQKFEYHYTEDHEVDQNSVEIETGATLLSGTTINGNEAIHVGMDGAGSNVDADVVLGNEALKTASFYSFSTDFELDNISIDTNGIYVNNNDSLWYTDGSSVRKVDQSASVEKSFSSASLGTHGVCLDSFSSVWTTNTLDESIYKQNQSGTVLDGFNSPSEGAEFDRAPYGIDADSSDSLYIAEPDLDAISKINRAGSVVNEIDLPTMGGVSGVHVVDSSSVWVSGTDDTPNNVDRVKLIDTSNESVIEFFEPPAADAVTKDSNGSFWLNNINTDKVIKTKNESFYTYS